MSSTTSMTFMGTIQPSGIKISRIMVLYSVTQTLSAQGATLDNCFGFVDGTVRPISRPDERQRIVYNGHKRVHALKFTSLSLSNGLIGNLYGPAGEFSFFLE